MEMTRALEVIKANGIEAKLNTVNKNGIKKACLIVGKGTVRPTLYEEHVRVMESESELMEFVDKVLADVPTINANNISSKEYVLKHVKTRLQCPTEANIVKRNFLDLEEYMVVELPDVGGTYKVTPELLERIGVSADYLFRKAKANGKSDVKTMGLGESIGMSEDYGMMVMSNELKSNGAVAMTYLPSLMKGKGKYYIIPSSIHEIILVEADTENKENLKNMIREVNNTQLTPEERLSYNLYYFNGSTVKIVK